MLWIEHACHYPSSGCLAVLMGRQTVTVGVIKAGSEEAAVVDTVTKSARQASRLNQHHSWDCHLSVPRCGGGPSGRQV